MPDIWTTKGGQEIPISQMTDSHLSNTIKMLRKKYYNWAFATNFQESISACPRYCDISDNIVDAFEEWSGYLLSQDGFDKTIGEKFPVFQILLLEQIKRNAS